METNNKIDILLRSITDDFGEELQLNREAIDKDLTLDQSAYQGLGIKLLSIAGGLLAAAFFLGFVSISLMSEPGAVLFFGLLVMGGAIALNKTSTNTVLDTLLISSYLASYAMIAFGMSKLEIDPNIIAAALLLLAIITTVITSGYMLNFFSVLVASGCLFSFVFINNTYETVHVYTLLFASGYAWLSLSEAGLIAQNRPLNTRYMALRNGLLFAFIGLLCYVGINGFHRSELSDGYLSGGIIILVTGFALYQLVAPLALETKSKGLIYVMGGLVLLSAVFAPAICGALLIVFLSFHTGHRTGQIVGIIALIYFTGQYYYDLDQTLLEKSELMMASGAIFLAAWFILKKQLKRYEQN